MAATYQSLYPPAPVARSLASNPDAGDVPLQIAIKDIILTAISASGFSTTIDLSAYAPLLIQGQINILAGLGYTVSYSVATLTISF